MTRTAGSWRGRTRTRAVVDWEVADLRDESAYPGSCGVSLNRCDTADRAEFRRRLLPGNMPCDGRSNFLDDVRTGDIGDDAQPTAAVRADRQIDRSTDRQIDRSTDRQIDCEYSRAGVSEIRVQHNGQWRLMYVAKFEEGIYVLHAFRKTTQRTSPADIEVTRSRLGDLIKERRRNG